MGIAVAVLVLTAFTNPYFFLKSSGKAFGEKEYRQVVRKELRIVAWVLIATICCAALVAAWFYLSEPPNRL